MRELREQITAIDRALLEGFNRRLEAVARLKRHKDENGIAFVDREREEAMLRHLTDENSGPLSGQGLAELYAAVLELTKRELARAEPPETA